MRRPANSGQDIRKLRGPASTYFALANIMLDVFSRFIIGWMIAERQTAALAEQFIAVMHPAEHRRGGVRRSMPTAATP
ncbi:MAG: hypothetical protein U0641_09055 [Anaerolineae bacterium]